LDRVSKLHQNFSKRGEAGTVSRPGSSENFDLWGQGVRRRWRG